MFEAYRRGIVERTKTVKRVNRRKKNEEGSRGRQNKEKKRKGRREKCRHSDVAWVSGGLK